MAIKVEKESDEVFQEFGGLTEVCVFCALPTRYWHNRTNNPVCQECAPTHKVSELKDWRKAARQRAYRNAKKDQQHD